MPDSPGTVAAQAAQSAPADDAAANDATAAAAAAKKAEIEGQQSKRIFGVIPNFRSVSVTDKFVPLSPEREVQAGIHQQF